MQKMKTAVTERTVGCTANYLSPKMEPMRLCSHKLICQSPGLYVDDPFNPEDPEETM